MITLAINSVDKTNQVETGSLVIQNILTKKRDMASFTILSHSGDSYVPTMGQDVTITLDAVKIFGGVITGIESQPTAFNSVRHKIDCQDYTRLLDRRLVPDSYENQTVNAIISDLKTRYFPSGFTINNVNAAITIKYVSFNYKPLAKCLQELAELINYDWYVDYDKDVHFFAKEAVLAPFDLTDSGGKFEYDSLIVRRDNSQVRNTIVVRGGDYLAAQTTFDIQTNGVDFVFPLPYKFSDFHASLTGHVPLSVGIDNIHDPDNYDALYNFQEKILRFKATDTPSSGKTLLVSGKPNLPVIIKYQSSDDVATMSAAEGTDGVYEYLVVDKSINSKEGARQRARAEILAYAQTLSEGEFITTTAGLKAGQKININSASRSINSDYIISKVEIRQFSKDTMKYKITLITTNTFDLIDILQRLLLESTKKLEIDPNETVDNVFNLSDSLALSDEVSAVTTSIPPYEWDFFDWDFGTWN